MNVEEETILNSIYKRAEKGKIIEISDKNKRIIKRGFRNEIFQTLNKPVDHLCSAIRFISADTITSITARD